MKRSYLIAILLAAALLIGGVAVYATQGDESDPLITLSYLNEVITPKLNDAVDEAVNKNTEELTRQLDIAISSYETRVDEKLAEAATAAYQETRLSRGEKLLLSSGREILLVSGSATAVGDLVDSTDGTVVRGGGTLIAGHLYVTTANDTGLQAGAAVRTLHR